VKKQEGFTLIETLIYIAFFAVLVGSLLGITFQTIDNSARLSKKITIQQEANFILRKIEWAINSGEVVSSAGNVLTVTLYDGGGIVEFKRDGDNMVIVRGTEIKELNSENVKVTDVSIQNPTASEFKISLNVEGENFQLTKFLRK
jgi:Tfp pilus assembly protein PilV